MLQMIIHRCKYMHNFNNNTRFFIFFSVLFIWNNPRNAWRILFIVFERSFWYV